jgi:hypothetical protein
MYTAIRFCELCQVGKKLYQDIEKMEKRYNVKQVGITKNQFDLLLAGIPAQSKIMYDREIPVGKLTVKRL